MSIGDFKDKTVAGVILAAAVVFFNKGLSLISQIILAFYLSQDEFGLFGMILGAMSFVSAFQNPGLGRIHTQLQICNGPLFKKSFRLSLISSLIGAALLIFIVNTFYNNNKTLYLMSMIAAVTFPLIGIYSLLLSKIEIARNYQIIARYQVVSGFSNNFILIILAMTGLGALSFTVALLISSVLTMLYVYINYAKMNLPNDANLISCDVNKNHGYYHSVAWSFIGALLLSISLRGDYFVLGVTLSERDVGLYYFGFMLAANVGLLLSSALSSVLMPAFSNLKDLKIRGQMYIAGCRRILLVAFWLCFAAIVCIPFIVNTLWDGKWNDSILLCQLFLMTLPLKLLAPLSIAYLESLGKWKIKAFALLIDGLTLIGCCYVGVIYAGLIGAAIGAAAQRGTLGVITVYFSLKSIEGPTSKERYKFIYDIGFLQLLIFITCIIDINNIANGNLSYFLIFTMAVFYILYSSVFNRSLYISVVSTMFDVVKKRAV